MGSSCYVDTAMGDDAGSAKGISTAMGDDLGSVGTAKTAARGDVGPAPILLGQNGVARVIDLIKMMEVQGLPSKVIATSFHNVEQVHKLILAGVPAVTVPPAVAEAMMDHPGTVGAVDDFTEDWRKAYGRDTLFA